MAVQGAATACLGCTPPVALLLGSACEWSTVVCLMSLSSAQFPQHHMLTGRRGGAAGRKARGSWSRCMGNGAGLSARIRFCRNRSCAPSCSGVAALRAAKPQAAGADAWATVLALAALRSRLRSEQALWSDWEVGLLMRCLVWPAWCGTDGAACHARLLSAAWACVRPEHAYAPCKVPDGGQHGVGLCCLGDRCCRPHKSIGNFRGSGAIRW